MKKGLGEFCETTEGCKIENTECTDRKTCECKSNYIAQNDLCKPGRLAPCDETNDCAFDNAECKFKIIDEVKTEKRCDCKENFTSVDDTCLEDGKIIITRLKNF